VVELQGLNADYAQARGASALGSTYDSGAWSNEYSSCIPESADFAKAYEAAYDGEVPIQIAANAYDAMWLAARAIRTAGSIDREAVAEAMAELAEHCTEDRPPTECSKRSCRATDSLRGMS
jgi:ABC-type branched-subunit amino acid transport system substrate-binding protein